MSWTKIDNYYNKTDFGIGDPDQVKRWYSIVRHHYGVPTMPEPVSPASPSPTERMPPPPRHVSRPHKVLYHGGPPGATNGHGPMAAPPHGLGLQTVFPSPHTPAQTPRLPPYSSPSVSTDPGSYSRMGSSGFPSPPDAKFAPSQGHDTPYWPSSSMSAFTGAGLVPTSKTWSSEGFITPDSPVPPFRFNFYMNNGIMPPGANQDSEQQHDRPGVQPRAAHPAGASTPPRPALKRSRTSQAIPGKVESEETPPRKRFVQFSDPVEHRSPNPPHGMTEFSDQTPEQFIHRPQTSFGKLQRTSSDEFLDAMRDPSRLDVRQSIEVDAKPCHLAFESSPHPPYQSPYAPVY